MKAAQQSEASQVEADQGQYLTFMLGGEPFGIGILSIKEIIEYGRLTEVPMAPACIRGVINLRGAVVPVMDLSVRFGKQPSPVTKRTCIVIVEGARNGRREDVGLVVDAVNAVVQISPADVEPAPTFGARIRKEFIHGLGNVEGQFVVLLHTNLVLALEDLPAGASDPVATAV